MESKKPSASSFDKLQSILCEGPQRSFYEEVTARSHASPEASSEYLTHRDPKCRMISVIVITERWRLDGQIVDKVIEAIESTEDEPLLWQLYFLLGRNEDRANATRILAYLVGALENPDVCRHAKSAIYASIIMQSQRVGIFHGSTIEFIDNITMGTDDDVLITMFDRYLLEKVRRLVSSGENFTSQSPNP